MYMSTYFIQYIVSKNVDVIMEKCAQQTISLMLTQPVVMSMIC